MSMTLQHDGLVGAQQPRISRVPEYVSSAGEEAVDLARAAGLHLDPWQAHVLEMSLGERADGRWSAFEVALMVPRQNGKGAVLEARELAGLFLFGENLILHSAHEFKTAQEAFLRILELVEGNPDFASKVQRVRSSHGEEGIELKTGQRLRFVARSRASGRGFTGDLIVLDEAFALTSKMTRALLPTLSARPNPQVWYTSSVGDETATELEKIRKRGYEGSGRMAFMEWSAPEDVDLSDPDSWLAAVVEANPGLGLRISVEHVRDEWNALGGDEDGFAMERLGIARGLQMIRAIDEATWEKVKGDGTETLVAPIRLALEVLPDRSAGALVAGGGGVVEVVEHRRGTGWMIRRVLELAGSWGALPVVDGNGPAASIADDIETEDEDIEIERMTTAQVASACMRFLDAVHNERVTIKNPEHGLDAAVASAAKRSIGDRFIWSRTSSGADVSPLMAASLAHVPADGPSEPLIAIR